MKIRIVIDIPNRNIRSLWRNIGILLFFHYLCYIKQCSGYKIIQSKSFKSILCTIVKRSSQNVQHNYHKLHNPSLHLSIQNWNSTRIEMWLEMIFRLCFRLLHILILAWMINLFYLLRRLVSTMDSINITI